ncbi:MAG: hypothetical protein DCF30_22160 [Hyphomicrobiales bacterium]|nr:MAG: hypothetical protein DCF30_22160 [Hyphomicrobiales bacterium]
MTVATLQSRKRAEASRRKNAAAGVIEFLRAYAVQEGGRFVVFGSSTSGEMRYDSDIDVLVDFPPEKAAAAIVYVEDVCAAHALPADIFDASTTIETFVRRVQANGLCLP